MGSTQESSNKLRKNNYMKMDKIRFEEASLDIYLVGKYNRLMDILIGDRNDIINESQEEKFL